jgi:hypothetical protein
MSGENSTEWRKLHLLKVLMYQGVADFWYKKSGVSGEKTGINRKIKSKIHFHFFVYPFFYSTLSTLSTLEKTKKRQNPHKLRFFSVAGESGVSPLTQIYSTRFMSI